MASSLKTIAVTTDAVHLRYDAAELEAARAVAVLVPGALSPGVSAVFPKITAEFQATGSPGSTIETQYAGTGYGDASLIFSTRVTNVPLLGSLTTTSYCYADVVNPILSTTQIT